MKIVSLLFLAVFIEANAQIDWVKRATALWSESEIIKANTAFDNTLLSQEERDLILLMNLCRLNGKKFWNTLGVPYLDSMRQSNSYTRSLGRDLEQVFERPMLKVAAGLFEAAKAHALDMGKTGRIGHNSSDGTSFFVRIGKYYNARKALAENCSYGYKDAMDILMQLLVDEGIPSVGHRVNILNPRYNYVGVSIQPHKNYRWNCVMDFSE